MELMLRKWACGKTSSNEMSEDQMSFVRNCTIAWENTNLSRHMQFMYGRVRMILYLCWTGWRFAVMVGSRSTPCPLSIMNRAVQWMWHTNAGSCTLHTQSCKVVDHWQCAQFKSTCTDTGVDRTLAVKTIQSSNYLHNIVVDDYLYDAPNPQGLSKKDKE